MPSADFCAEVERPCDLPSRSSYASVGFDTTQTSRGKFDRLLRTTAEFTAAVLDGYGLRGFMPARPAVTASYPVPVRRLTHLIHASSSPRLTTTPLRFTFLHLHQVGEGTPTPQTVKHARHTWRGPVPSRSWKRGVGFQAMSCSEAVWFRTTRRLRFPQTTNPGRGRSRRLR